MNLNSPCWKCEIYKADPQCSDGCKEVEKFKANKQRLFNGTFSRHPEISGEYCKEHGHYRPCAHCKPVICPHCGMDINKPDGPKPWGLGK